ncbi:ABC transporter substrate-binding protein [Streptomyces sp. NPDC055078]
MVVLALVLTACGGGATGKDSRGNTAFTVAMPFESCTAWWPLYVAAEKGYYEEEGVAPKFEGLDGSGAAVQAALSGKAALALSAADNYLTAVDSGADLKGFYSVYTAQAFSLVTRADSGIKTLKDVADTKVGISTPGGGDVTYASSLLKIGADLTVDTDYQQFAVGEGSAAATALQKNVVKTYSASFFDEEVIKAGGVELRRLDDADYPQVTGGFLVGAGAWVDKNTKAVDGMGRAIARATQYGLAHRDEVVNLCAKLMPEEASDRKFARIIVDRVAELAKPAPSSGGRFGHIDEKGWAKYRKALIDLKIVGRGAAKADVDNSRVDAWNR